MAGSEDTQATPESALLEDALHERLNGHGASTSGRDQQSAAHQKGKKHTYRTAGKKGKQAVIIDYQQTCKMLPIMPLALQHVIAWHSILCIGTPNDDEGQIMCIETARGHKRIYRRLDRHGEGWDGFDVTDDKVGMYNLSCMHTKRPQDTCSQLWCADSSFRRLW